MKRWIYGIAGIGVIAIALVISTGEAGHTPADRRALEEIREYAKCMQKAANIALEGRSDERVLQMKGAWNYSRSCARNLEARMNDELSHWGSSR
jgi:hypothetical protein